MTNETTNEIKGKVNEIYSDLSHYIENGFYRVEKLKQFKKELNKIWNKCPISEFDEKINSLEKKIREEKDEYLEKILPKIEQEIYIDEYYAYEHFPLKRGGLVKVIERYSKRINFYPWFNDVFNLKVQIMGDDGKKYTDSVCWETLLNKQKRLKKQYKNQRALVDGECYSRIRSLDSVGGE